MSSSGFHAVLDRRVNEYVGPNAGTTPYLYLARFFISAGEAVAWLARHGFGEQQAKNFVIGDTGKLPLVTFGGAAAKLKLLTVQDAAKAVPPPRLTEKEKHLAERLAEQIGQKADAVVRDRVRTARRTKRRKAP